MKHPLRLLVANVFFEPFSYGGATIVAEEVVRELRRQTDWEIFVVSTSADVGLLPYSLLRTEAAGGANFIIPLPTYVSPADSYNNERVTQILHELITALEPDVVHAHCAQRMGGGIINAAVSRGIPVITSVHDFWWLCERQFMINNQGRYCGLDRISPDSCRVCVDSISATRERDRVLRAALNSSSAITYPSSFTRDLHENSGINPANGFVWANGVQLPEDHFFAMQADRRRSDPRYSFGFVGGPSIIKGWPLIRQAFGLLKRSDFVVHVVDATSDGSWWRLGDFTGLPGEWRIVPRYSQANIDDFYARLDGLLFLSQWKETFGLTIREAACRGLEIVQTTGGGTTEYEGFSQARVVQIGDSAEIIAQQLEAALEERQTIRPTPVRSYAEQASEFISLMKTVTPRVTSP